MQPDRHHRVADIFLRPRPVIVQQLAGLAKQRAIDSAYEGEDPDTQRAVFDRTFSDCMAWEAKHRS